MFGTAGTRPPHGHEKRFSETLRDHGVHVDMEPSHPKMGVLVREAAEQSAGILAAQRRTKAAERSHQGALEKSVGPE